MADAKRKASTSSSSSSSSTALPPLHPQDHASLSLQSEELSRASLAQSDFDYAYQLQLQEALSASCDQVHPPSPPPPPSPEDRSLAFALQNLEVTHGEQQARDQLCVRREAELLRLELKRRTHDAKFAEYLEQMDDRDWESHGDNCEKHFRPDSDGSDDESLPYMLYCASASSGNGMIGEAPSAIGAVVLDSRGNVLTEMSKAVDQGTGKIAADRMALVAGLETARAMGLKNVEAHIDSMIVFRQVRRVWRTSRKVRGLLSLIDEHVRSLQAFNLIVEARSQNNHAIRLAREAVNLQLVGKNSTSKEHPGAYKVCSICLEEKHQNEIFCISQCSHEFCQSCIVQHAQVKVQAGKVPVQCPQVGCHQTLSLSDCKSILNQKWYDLLNKRLIEMSIPESERVYCPFPNCSALMDGRDLHAIKKRTDQGASTSSGHSTTNTGRTECSECHRFFCLDCRSPWHSSMSCQASTLKDAQDAKLYQLAENKNWQRCKMCRRMIELAEGCYHMMCRCGYEFCYLCGEPWKNKRQTCKCRLWDEDYLLDEPISESDEFSDDFSEGFDEDSDFEDMEQVARMPNFYFASDAVPLNNQFYKTKLCKYWERGNCYAGDSCNFAHGVHELR